MLSKPDFLFKNVVLVMTKNKEKLSFKNDNLIIKNDEDKIILQKTCYRIFSLWIVGPFLITSGLLERAIKFGFSIVFFSFSFKYINALNVKTEGNVLLRKKQYESKDWNIGRYLVDNKIKNQTLLLKSLRSKSQSCKDNIVNLEKLNEIELFDAKNLHEIMGVEGVASRIFFGEFFTQLNWIGRKPRAKIDSTNVLMDIGYTLLFNYIEGMLNLYGFDVYCGFYHRFFYQRKSLVCDMVEPFRCIIDKQIRKAHNLGQIKAEDFQSYKGKCLLPYKNSKPYLKFLTESILNEKEEIFLYIQSFYRAFMNNKPIKEYPIFTIK